MIIFLYFSVKYNQEIVIAQKKMRMQDEQAEKDIKEEKKVVREELGVLTSETEEYSNPRWRQVKELMKSKNRQTKFYSLMKFTQ